MTIYKVFMQNYINSSTVGSKYFLRKNDAENYKGELERSVGLLNLLGIYAIFIYEIEVVE